MLPIATISEKLKFPMKFERDAFCLDFSSANSPASDCETTGLRLSKIRKLKGSLNSSVRRNFDFSETNKTSESELASVDSELLDFKFEKTLQKNKASETELCLDFMDN